MLFLLLWACDGSDIVAVIPCKTPLVYYGTHLVNLWAMKVISLGLWCLQSPFCTCSWSWCLNLVCLALASLSYGQVQPMFVNQAKEFMCALLTCAVNGGMLELGRRTVLILQTSAGACSLFDLFRKSLIEGRKTSEENWSAPTESVITDCRSCGRPCRPLQRGPPASWLLGSTMKASLP